MPRSGIFLVFAHFLLHSSRSGNFFIPIGCNCVVVLIPDVTCLHGFLLKFHALFTCKPLIFKGIFPSFAQSFLTLLGLRCS